MVVRKLFGNAVTLVRRLRTALAVVAALGLAGGLAISSSWPFNEVAPKLGGDPSLWRMLLSERLMLGFVRLAIAAAALFLITSIFVLAANNRWIVKLGATEASTEQLDQTIGDYEEQVRELTEERDQYRDLVDVETAPDG